MDILETDLAWRCVRTLGNQGINTLEQLSHYSARELLQFSEFGARCLQEVNRVMQENGLALSAETDCRQRRIEQLASEGLSMAAIGRLERISRSAVWQRLKRR